MAGTQPHAGQLVASAPVGPAMIVEIASRAVRTALQRMTPNAIAAIKHVADNLARGTVQRAWKIVGPYGSGKSALGVVLAQLMSGPKRHEPAAQALAATAPQVAGLLASSNRLPLAVVGTRVSFGAALATAIATASKGWKKGSSLSNLFGQIDLDRQMYAKQPLDLAIGQLLDDFTNAARASGYHGVALFIDEVGKFIEYAALYPEHGDLIALQQVAEKANKANDDGLVVLAMLHQHFASYAAGVGRSLSDEWHKVAARFEEIPFDEPVERYVHFASHAMRGKPALASLPEKAQKGKELDITAYPFEEKWGGNEGKFVAVVRNSNCSSPYCRVADGQEFRTELPARVVFRLESAATMEDSEACADNGILPTT